MLSLRSLRLRRHTLSAIRPIAMTNVATAATDRPAICAGVIFGEASAAAAAGTGVDEADAVADGSVETVSAKADCDPFGGDCAAVVLIGMLLVIDLCDDMVVGRGLLLAMTV